MRLFGPIVSAVISTTCVLFPGIAGANDAANALILKTRQAPDALNLKCDGNNENVFYFTVSETQKAVVWSSAKNVDQRSIYADGKDTGLGSKAIVKIDANHISWTVKTAYGRNYGAIDLKKLELNMHSIFDENDIENIGPCTKL